MLTMMTLISTSRSVSSTVPKVSEANAMDIYSIICILFNFCSLLEFGFVNNIWHRTDEVRVKRVDTPHVLKATISPMIGRKIKKPMAAPDGSSPITASRVDVQEVSYVLISKR